MTITVITKSNKKQTKVFPDDLPMDRYWDKDNIRCCNKICKLMKIDLTSIKSVHVDVIK